jgi:hypothetical protein
MPDARIQTNPPPDSRYARMQCSSPSPNTRLDTDPAGKLHIQQLSEGVYELTGDADHKR